MTANTLRQRLVERRGAGGLISAPGVYDMISLRLADRLDFDALYMTGYGTVASHLGLPDAGLATYSDMVGRVERMAQTARTPLIADADTGYGGPLNVEYTVRGYERAGAAAIQLEDQEWPKRCGHTPNRRVIPAEDMVQKVRVAVQSRVSREFLVVARTDARGGTGSVWTKRCAAASCTPAPAPTCCSSRVPRPSKSWRGSVKRSTAALGWWPTWWRAGARRSSAPTIWRGWVSRWRSIR